MTRKAPEMPAKNFEVGKRKRGVDGEMYVVATYMREGKRFKKWVKVKKRSTTSPKRMDGFKFRRRKENKENKENKKRGKVDKIPDYISLPIPKNVYSDRRLSEKIEHYPGDKYGSLYYHELDNWSPTESKPDDASQYGSSPYWDAYGPPYIYIDSDDDFIYAEIDSGNYAEIDSDDYEEIDDNPEGQIVYIRTPERTPEKTPIYSTPNRIKRSPSLPAKTRSPKYVYDYPKINGKRIVQETMLARNPKNTKKSRKSKRN